MTASGKCTKTVKCVAYGKGGPHIRCKRLIHCTIAKGHKSGHRFGSHASQH